MEHLFLLLLLVTANGAPILAQRLLERRVPAIPLDGGVKFFDGRPLLGSSKTLRGLLASLAATPAVAWSVGVAPALGLEVALAAMAGDLLSSFTKRRLGLNPSDRAPGLDQIPESLLPLLAVRERLSLAWSEIALLTLLFTIVEIWLSPLLYHLRIRRRPW